ncbi:hypothetical protein C0585_07710 [Candidatus Woesearchaeota archaeon]|nr:MAG: hypothetical protein C0585_07710 [Candidatus Woesearchaeota archaeon]
MKLILSRKGFDSSAGGVPSPIFEDNTMLSLPIPDETSIITYDELKTHKSESVGKIVSDLTNGKIKGKDNVHIDPDIFPGTIKRNNGWKPIFGQKDLAQSHLKNNGIGIGDIFLFFGLFREVEKIKGVYQFDKSSRPKHVLWGWFQIGQIIHLSKEETDNLSWAKYHPHFQFENSKNNTLYIASEKLNIDKKELNINGSGVFRKYRVELCLSCPDSHKITDWVLPKWFYPEKGKIPLSYHKNLKRWKKDGSLCRLSSVGRGQEFVLDCNQYPESLNWIKELIIKNFESNI